MRVTFFQRRPQGANFSIERLFGDIRAALPTGTDAKVAVSRFPSRGLFRRVYNVVEAAFRQGQVNHVTGDVHYLTYLLDKNRTLLTVLDLVSLHRLQGWRRRVFLYLWFWLPVRRAAVVSVISEFTRQELLRYIKMDPRQVRVVHCCVSADFRFAPRDFNVAKPTIVQIGTGANKNVERVAEALRGVSCHLRVIGRLSERHTAVLQRCGVEYTSVSNVPNDQIVEEYRRCDMLVFASTYEGFGLPIVEAQATGRPVVTSDSCSMPEVAGGAACLVDPFDAASIREGILKIISDPPYRNKLVSLGLENVVRFRPERIAQEYVDIYAELLSP